MRMLLLCILVTAILICRGEAVLLDDFEGAGKWMFANGPEFPGASGSFEVGSEGAHSGKKGGVLSFNFTKGGNYVQTRLKLSDGVDARGFTLFIRKPCRNRLSVRVTDSESQTFQKGFDIPHQEWQKVRITLSGWQGFWGGKGDGVFRGKPTEFAILVENRGVGGTGKVYLDDVQTIAAGSGSDMSEALYTVTDFESDGWRLLHPGVAGNAVLTGNNLSFDFRRGAKEIGVRNEIALMGSPQELQLTVDTRVKGCSVIMRMPSHFQTFEKVIGELSGRGLQTLTVPLGDMRGWRHYGGENDGIVRWPLRLMIIALQRGDGPETGDVRFVSVKVKTRIAGESAVVLVPRVEQKDGIARFSCELTNILPKASSGRIEWAIRDYSGAVLSEGNSDHRIGAGQTTVFTQDFPQGDRPFTDCRFQYSSGGRTYGPVSVSSVGALTSSSALREADGDVGAPGTSALDPESIYGMGVYLYRYPGTPEGFARMEEAAKMAAAAGVKWSREEFGWARIEPEKGRFDWSFYDTMVDTAHRQGISVYGLISYWSGWTKPNTPEGIEDYARYCKALVTRYKGKIKYWEVWNEPNIFFWTGPKEMYADLLKAAYKAIKEADPEAEVLGCSTSMIDVEFIKMVMDKGAPFDALTIHPYRASLDDETFIRVLRETYELTAAKDGKRKPVWITEMGWPTDLPDGASEREQASLLARTYLCAAASGVVRSVSWYDFREDGDCPFYGEHRFGIVRNPDLSPKPAYRALAAVTSNLDGRKLVGRLNLGAGILAYEFSDGKRDTVVVWSPEKDAVALLNITGASLTISDLMGSVQPLARTGSKAMVVLRANDPVFITGERLGVAGAKCVSVDRPGGTTPGGTVRVRLRGGDAIEGLTAELEPPRGWRVKRVKGGMDVQSPEDAEGAAAEFILRIKYGSEEYAFPFELRLTASTMEV